MRYGYAFVALILLQAFNAMSSQSSIDPQGAQASQATARTRLLVSGDGELADGATLSMKTLIGGAIVRVEKEERGEVVESTIQSITNNEAANLRALIAGASKECPVQLTFVQDQLVQAKSVCQ